MYHIRVDELTRDCTIEVRLRRQRQSRLDIQEVAIRKLLYGRRSHDMHLVSAAAPATSLFDLRLDYRAPPLLLSLLIMVLPRFPKQAWARQIAWRYAWGALYPRTS
jgi:hypothetical protein